MFNKSSCGKAFMCIGLMWFSLAAAAFEDRSPGIYLEGGRSPHGPESTNSLSLGVVVPWAPFQVLRDGPVSFYGDFFVSQWRAPNASDTENQSYTQIGAVANLRYRFDNGASPWFTEAGLGATLLDGIYNTPVRLFSTRFQFTEYLGVGRSFGSRGEHELSLRVQHFSNADIKQPNPGENFWRVRYLYRF